MIDTARVFLDTSVLVRYFADDDPPRVLAAARLVEGDSVLCISTTVLMECIHVLRTEYGLANPHLADIMATFLARANVELADADKIGAIAALRRARSVSPRRIMDALIAEAAEKAGCSVIVAFDRDFDSPYVPVRLI